MDRHERAEMAVRLVGLAVLVHGGAALIRAIAWTAAVASKVSSGSVGIGSVWQLVLAQYGGPALAALLGVGLLAGAGAVGGLLVPARAELGEPAAAEMFGLGTFALGIYFLIRALPFLLWTGTTVTQEIVRSGGSLRGILPGRSMGLGDQVLRAYAIGAVAGGLTAGVLLVGGQVLARRVLARRWAGRGLSLAGLLGTGFALMAIFTALRAVVSYPYERAWLALPITRPGHSLGDSVTWLNVTTALRLAQGLVLLALCGRAGRWLARGAPESPRPVLRTLGKEGWMAAALSGLMLWSMLMIMGSLRGLGSLGLAQPLGPVAQWAIAGAAPVVVLASMVAAGRWGAGAAHGSPEGVVDSGAALVAVEVTVTVAALHQLLLPGWSAVGAIYSPLPMLLTIGLTLVLRGDVARWCVGGTADAKELRERRRAALYPLLSLLGVVMVLGWARLAGLAALVQAGVLPASPSHVPNASGGTLSGSLPYVQLAGAVVLLLARRPLCRLLSCGPLLHRGRGGAS